MPAERPGTLRVDLVVAAISCSAPRASRISAALLQKSRIGTDFIFQIPCYDACTWQVRMHNRVRFVNAHRPRHVGPDGNPPSDFWVAPPGPETAPVAREGRLVYGARSDISAVIGRYERQHGCKGHRRAPQTVTLTGDNADGSKTWLCGSPNTTGCMPEP